MSRLLVTSYGYKELKQAIECAIDREGSLEATGTREKVSAARNNGNLLWRMADKVDSNFSNTKLNQTTGNFNTRRRASIPNNFAKLELSKVSKMEQFDIKANPRKRNISKEPSIDKSLEVGIKKPLSGSKNSHESQKVLQLQLLASNRGITIPFQLLAENSKYCPSPATTNSPLASPRKRQGVLASHNRLNYEAPQPDPILPLNKLGPLKIENKLKKLLNDNKSSAYVRRRVTRSLDKLQDYSSLIKTNHTCQDFFKYFRPGPDKAPEIYQSEIDSKSGMMTGIKMNQYDFTKVPLPKDILQNMANKKLVPIHAEVAKLDSSIRLYKERSKYFKPFKFLRENVDGKLILKELTMIKLGPDEVHRDMLKYSSHKKLILDDANSIRRGGMKSSKTSTSLKYAKGYVPDSEKGPQTNQNRLIGQDTYTVLRKFKNVLK